MFLVKKKKGMRDGDTFLLKEKEVWRIGLDQEAGVEGVQSRKGGGVRGMFTSKV